jgi:hypothetical protein
MDFKFALSIARFSTPTLWEGLFGVLSRYLKEAKFFQAAKGPLVMQDGFILRMRKTALQMTALRCLQTPADLCESVHQLYPPTAHWWPREMT